MIIEIDDSELTRIASKIPGLFNGCSDTIVHMLIGAIGEDNEQAKPLIDLLRWVEKEMRSLTSELSDAEYERDEAQNERDDLERQLEESKPDPVNEMLINRIVDAATALRALREGRGIIPSDAERIETLPTELDQIAVALRTVN